MALVRKGAAEEKVNALKAAGVRVETVDISNQKETAEKLSGVGCVVSALQGLRDVIVETQGRLLEAALAASVPRFVPSDYSTDFLEQHAGENRNFDLRREFHQQLSVTAIRATAIFNGAFAEILHYGTPLLNVKEKSVAYWEDPDWRMDFTTMDDTAAYTAAASLDEHAPEALHIASFSVSAKEMADMAGKIAGAPFELKRMGSLEELRSQNKRDREAHPEGERELYPAWQQAQYLQSMFSTHHSQLDNDRYAGLTWASFEDVLRGVLAGASRKGA
jgi:hypothetical protein